MLLPYGLTVSRKPPSSQVGEGELQVLHAGRNPASAASEPSSTPSTGVLRTAEAFQHVYRQRPTSTQADVQSTLMWCKVVRSDVCQLGLLETSVCPLPHPCRDGQCLGAVPVAPHLSLSWWRSSGRRECRGQSSPQRTAPLLALMLARDEGDGCLVGRALLQHRPAPGKVRGWGFGKHCVVSS